MESKPYKCTKCEVEFGDFAKLWEHMEVCGQGLLIPHLNASMFTIEGIFTIVTSSGFTGRVYFGKDGRLYRCMEDGKEIELVKGGSKSE